MAEVLRWAVYTVVLGFLAWRFAHDARGHGGWTWARRTGAHWFLVLMLLSFAGGMWISSKPEGISRSARVLLGLAGFAGMGAGLVGFLWRMSATQPKRLEELVSRLREDGHLASDDTAPLLARTQSELELLAERLFEAQHTLHHIAEWKRQPFAGDAVLIERDLARVDSALTALRIASRQSERQLIQG